MNRGTTRHVTVDYRTVLVTRIIVFAKYDVNVYEVKYEYHLHVKENE